MYLKKQNKEFAMTFRSFGHDLPNIIYEFNLFCIGEHPCFNGRNNMPLVKMNGAKNTKDFRFKVDEQKGQTYRFSEDIHDTILVLGPSYR